MNEQAMNFWTDYWKKDPPTMEFDAFQFGDDADYLADLVVHGKKTATCSIHLLYELEGKPLPEAGQYSVILDSQNAPVAIIQVMNVSLMPMNKVSEEFALAEGEGDYSFWWNAHEQFFTRQLEIHGVRYSKDLLLVCERFQVIYKALV